jgi:hypothetical protein
MKSKFTNEQINEVMERRGVNRKSALKFLNRTVNKKSAAPARAKDAKKAAANDKPEPGLTPEERGAARAVGVRLYILAGKPKKSDFVKVFGKQGPAWTWEARAKAVGLASAEECAASFQSLLKKAGRSCPGPSSVPVRSSPLLGR